MLLLPNLSRIDQANSIGTGRDGADDIPWADGFDKEFVVRSDLRQMKKRFEIITAIQGDVAM